jgi:hypothetical protein
LVQQLASLALTKRQKRAQIAFGQDCAADSDGRDLAVRLFW